MKKYIVFMIIMICAVSIPSFAGQVSKKSILKIAMKSADWQLENPHKTPIGDWAQGPFVEGLAAIGKLPGGKKYLKAVYDFGIQEKWGVISTTWKANDHCTPQAWIELYEIYKEPAMIAPIQKELDQMIEVVSKQNDSLEFDEANRMKWCWSDALFMSPPAFARLGKVTGDQKYYDYLNEWWWKASNFYYDPTEHLYYETQTFFSKREQNGAKVFWSRGNGWVIGALARVLQYLPENDPFRPKYEQQLREMCTKIKAIQCEDGLWRAGLLDPVAHQPETSGSAFFVFGIAYAINHGIIDRKAFEPVVEKAWTALCSYVQPDGRFTGTQPIGDSPKKYDGNYTMPYGVGAFLLAASEMYQLSR